MKPSFTRFLCVLGTLALLLVPVAALAEGEQRDPIELNIGSDRKAYVVVPGSGFDTDGMYLNGIPYTPQVNHRNDLIVRTGDLLAAKVIGELPNAEPTAFQIKNGKISLPYQISFTIPNYGEEAPPPTTETETKPNDKPFQYVEDRTSDERLAYPDEVIQKYAQALIDGVAGLIKVLESEHVRNAYIGPGGSVSGDPVEDAGIPALLTYVTSLLSSDPVTAEAFDNAMYAIYSKLCVVDDVAGKAVGNGGDFTRACVNGSALMATFRTVMEGSGYHLPEYLYTTTSPDGSTVVVHYGQGSWRIDDYGKLDELATVQKMLKETNPFQLKGVTFELSDGAGNVQPIKVTNVWQSPIVKEVDPNEVAPLPAPGNSDNPDNPDNSDTPDTPDIP